MVNVNEAHIARLKKQGRTFEILVDTEKALKFKNGADVPIEEILASYEIFKDAKKGERASGLKEVFGTEDIYEIAKIILKEGEIQLTAEYLRKLKEQKYREIVQLIHENALDPTTNLPIPIQRIENAMKEAKINIDPNKKPEEQLKDIVKKLKLVIPIKLQKKELMLTIPPELVGKIYHIVREMCEIEKEEWKNDGSLRMFISITAGKFGEFVEKIGKISHGSIEIKDRE